MKKKILIIDNFDSFTFNLAEYFERLGCHVEVFRNDVRPEAVENLAPAAIVFSPGPSVPSKAGNMLAIIKRFYRQTPMLGVCLGHQALIEFFGGSLKLVKPVHGESSAIEHDGKTIFAGLPENFAAGRYHSWAGDKIPDCFEISARGGGQVMAIRHKNLPIEGVQFHPESVLTMRGGAGLKIIANFLKSYLNLVEEVSMNLTEFLTRSMAGELSLPKQEAFLNKKIQITAEELAEAVEILRKKAASSINLPKAIDVCGTGGSGLPRINTSTIASFILASAGMPIAKHGNKAASGRFGSFDLLAELGIPFEVDDGTAEAVYKDVGLAFLYARRFHPIMGRFAEVRQRLARPTFFNLLGPLLNPARVERQIIGTAFPNQMKLIAETCRLLGKKHVLVLSGEDGLDEVTLTGKTKVVELENGKITTYDLNPEDFGVARTNFAAIKGGGPKENTQMAIDILSGSCQSRHLDLVLVNAALALKFFGKASTFPEAFQLAAQQIDSGNALTLLERMRRPNILSAIVAAKKKEVAARKKEISLSKLRQATSPSKRDFKAAISKPALAVIAEIKKASPTMKIIGPGLDVAARARQYERFGARAISVLCDKEYFLGSMADLRTAAEATSLPILAKEFIIDDYQIYEARQAGADAVLLIASILSEKKMNHFIALAAALGMDCLCEAHDRFDLDKVLKTKADIIGINNRNLNNFLIDFSTTRLLVPRIPVEKIIVIESGVCRAEDVAKLSGRVSAILVGTALMKAKDLGAKLEELTGAWKSANARVIDKKIKVKICGLRSLEMAKCCQRLGVDFIGLNFVPSSRRVISIGVADKICRLISGVVKVGIFQNQRLAAVNEIAERLNLDFIQLSGDEDIEYIKKCRRPVIKTIKVRTEVDVELAQKFVGQVAQIIFDGPEPGSGQMIERGLLKKFAGEFFIAGGLSPENVRERVEGIQVIGVDVASGVEEGGEISQVRVEEMMRKIKNI